MQLQTKKNNSRNLRKGGSEFLGNAAETAYGGFVFCL